jgi:3-hydroxyacyl-CoA dehydrogenase / enoyl-CoA hydratase / 3-hydroxybutyryl-CoA epimerase
LCEKLAAKHGPRFAPSRLLIDMAARNESFYGRFAPGRREKAAQRRGGSLQPAM